MGWEMQKLKRRGIERWSEIFTARNFYSACVLRRAILQKTSGPCQEWLLLTLTAALAQFSRMIADGSADAGGPSWKINCYWLPQRWQELNPLWYFRNRIKKSEAAVLDLWSIGAPFEGSSVLLGDSRQVPLERHSVDYIFTDPPYGGEGIQYGELSALWCLWLNETQDLDQEVAFNPYRGLTESHYATGLGDVFANCARVLRPGRWMTVAFANKDPEVWDALMNACRSAGFTLVTAAPMKRSAPSLTETNMWGAPKADLLLTFRSGAAPRTRTVRPDCVDGYSVSDAVRRIAGSLVDAGIEVTASDVFDRVTVDWFSWFYAVGSRPSSVQPTLANVEVILEDLKKYFSHD